MPARTRRSGSDAGLPRTASNGRGRPSQVTKVPALSVTGGDREHDVGRAGHVGLAQLEGHDERRRGERVAEGLRVRGVVGVDATDDAGRRARR